LDLSAAMLDIKFTTEWFGWGRGGRRRLLAT